ncbi:FKBP-type peptidyl-prolyl cis-trans isomerase [Polaribacter cellanae]|uniref:peptidylprolyl isomerase n=1 Tax=Polaribacter cellanae TaxID=2818493 RepID=A0A975CPD1_9FLAO|nr:peptidylprolyl isomerase [Polaribacter cellanae]QTE23238.1 peptidylprolyl isomerase [Polaribacter cellanae]
MNKIKNIFALLIVALVIFSSCDNDRNALVNPFADVDYKALALSDNDSIVKFLKTNYYDATEDLLKPLESGKTAIFEDSNNLKIVKVTQNEIEYTLYAYITEEGVSNSEKSNPTKLDSVFVNRTGVFLSKNKLITDKPFDVGNQSWWSLAPTFNAVISAPSPISGWTNGFPFFKSGENITNNGPITYKNTGKGYLFIPSGLAYPSINYVVGRSPSERPYDRILVFKVELLDFVKDTDHDNDGKPSIQEDANGDGDVTNDFSDSEKPKLPDYLNPNIK